MNKLYIYKDSSIYIGRSLPKKVHEHHALQLFIAPNKPLCINVNGKQVVCTSGLIKPDIAHHCTNEGIEIIFISLDPESLIARKLIEKYLAHAPFITFNDDVTSALIKKCSNPEFLSNPYDILLQLSGIGTPKVIDERILKVIEFLHHNITEPIDTSQLANMTFLSESRFLHFFKEQVHIPVRKYLHWLKIRKAIELLSEGNSFTEVAYSTGFSDPSHFNRIFTRMFGLSPSSFIQNSSFVQVEVVYEI